MAEPSPPIDIIPRLSSGSPINPSNNLMAAFQPTGKSPGPPMDIPLRSRDQGRPLAPGRQDSLGVPLSSSQACARSTSIGAQPRRDSNAGSYAAGGMSWGGVSVSSYLHDDILMTGTSPQHANSPSFHSSSYLPKMEANFWNGLRCCSSTFNDLHELLEHYEVIHGQAQTNLPYKPSFPGGGRFRRKSSNTASNQIDAVRAWNQRSSQQSAAEARSSSGHPQRGVQGQDGQNNKSSLAIVPDMETIGEMEMDLDPDQPAQTATGGYPDPNTRFQQNTNGARPPPVNSALANMAQHQLDPSQSADASTPIATTHGIPNQRNPVVSSVNTPTLTTKSQSAHPNHSTMDGVGSRTGGDSDQAVADQNQANAPFMNQQMGQQQAFPGFDIDGNGMIQLCINEPAKALFTEQGGINPQQFPHFGFMDGTTNPEEYATAIQDQQIAANREYLFGEEDRPFKCPVIGCEKAYKNANGLRYHEKHGHSTQKLKDNGDGSYSIIDPVTSVPYPGTVGMEKEKPYRCDVCGKRYKNLNGLKYHRNHSPPCNPDFNYNGMTLPGMESNPGVDSVF